MQEKDVEKHLEDYEAPIEELEGLLTDGLENDSPIIKTVPCCAKALVHDVIHFDITRLDFLHKLGEGKKQYPNNPLVTENS